MSASTSRRSRPASVFLSLALVCLIFFVQQFVVTQEELMGPIPTSGDRESAVVTDDFTVEVTGVDVSSALLAPSSGGGEGATPLEANGVWVVAWARVTAARTTIDSLSAQLRMGDDTVYSERDWFPDTLGRTPFSPGLPQEGAFVFEVPENRFDDPTLVLTHTPGYDDRLSAQATIDLGLPTAEPTGEPVTLRPPQIRMEDSDAPE